MGKKVVLLTGASGYLGGKICQSLLNHGYIVRAFVRRTSNLSSLPSATDNDSLEFAYGDVTDYPSLLAACSGCHVIIHTAALVEPWIPDPSKFFTVNIGGLNNVLRAYRESNTIEKIVYTSSFFAIGPTDGYVADESQVHPEKFFCTEYERSKAAADKIAVKAASEGVPILMLYPGVIYGSGKTTAGNFLARLIIERFDGRLPGYVGAGNDKHSFCHVEDVAEGHAAAIEKGQPGERYLLTGEIASINHVFDVVAILTATSKPRFHIPMWLIMIYGWVAILMAKISGNLPTISPPAVRVMQHQWAYSYEKAKKELGYNPRSLNEGVRELLVGLKDGKLISY